ncbi:unnamed protein product [Lactuca saligna]|uniref:Uncharacterized protein n=1 Tax=Lactuca saligna TaxID=75948 RepID=A0AA35YWP9_LACSI|nr:unnamed protein product [Lactuca saligna]
MFGYVLARRSKLDYIISLRCTKSKNELLKLHLAMKMLEYEYLEVVLSRELVNFGFIDRIQLQEIIDKYKGIHAKVGMAKNPIPNGEPETHTRFDWGIP